MKSITIPAVAQELKAGHVRRLYTRVMLGRWPMYVAGAIAMLLTSASEVLAPKLIQYAIDTLTGSGSIPWWLQSHDKESTLWSILAALLVLMLTGLFGRFAWRQFLARQTHVVGNRLKVALWDVLRFQPMHTFRRYPLGDLMNRAIGDWGSARIIFGFTLVLTFDVVFFTVLGAAAMLSIDWQLTLMCLAMFFIVPPFIRKLARAEHDQHAIAQEHLSDLSDAITQSLRSVRFQRATHSESRWQNRLNQLTDRYAESRLQVIKTGWKIFPWASLPTIFAYLILVTIGVSKVQDGILSAGELVAMSSFILLMQTPLLELGDCISEWQRGFASLKRMMDIFQLQSRPHPTELHDDTGNEDQVKNDKASIVFEGLSFSYSTQTPTLQNISLRVQEGEIIGIRGRLGSGKTTFANLIAGFERAAIGSLFLHGRDQSLLKENWFSKNVAMVPQLSFLFAGSIRENLCLDEYFSDETLWKVLTLVAIDEEVRNLSDGLNTIIGEWGINLSGGQKQRLCLARALLRDRSILILDDCLSAVDAQTEETILKSLEPFFRSRTIIWIAHRASTLRLCHRHFTLENGYLNEDCEEPS
jgi:ATP-binding cassette, subfamily B, multidrug efflux pump